MLKKKIIPLMLLLAIAGLAVAGSWGNWLKTPRTYVNDLPAFKDEYRKLQMHYMQNDSAMHLAGAITLYDGEQKGVVKEKTDFEMLKQDGQFYSQFSCLQTFYNGRLLVQLDSLNHIIVVSKNLKNAMSKNAFSQASFNALFSDTASFKITGKVMQESTGERTIIFKSELNPEVKSYSITYTPGTYQVRHATIEWWKDEAGIDVANKDQVWISRINYRHLPVTDIKIDELIKKVVTIKKNRIEPAPAYEQYQMSITNSEQ